MKTKVNIAMTTLIALTCTGYAESGVELLQGILAQTNHTLIPMLDVRARYEFGEQEGKDSSHATTLRARAGLQSQDYNGFSGLVEFEATRAKDSEAYRAANVHGPTSDTVIADPESTELNRAQLQFKRNGNLFIAGRQRIILDNARFIGNVGWRQNEQTFDAATYKNTSIDNLSLFYGYINDVQRIFGSDAPSGTGTDDFESDSHLINAAYTLAEGHKLTAYAYLLDFDNSAANSSDTLGLNYTFKGKITDGYTLKGYAEFAYQDDGGDNPTDYEALYYHLNGSIIRDGYSATLGYEVLGSDEGIASFRTPLATAHKFNGWNDQFLSTPTSGLQDAYIGIALPVPKYPVQLIYHYFTADDDSSFYGQEIDAVIAHKLSPKTKAIAKASYYDANGYNVDCTRFSLELNYKY